MLRAVVVAVFVAATDVVVVVFVSDGYSVSLFIMFKKLFDEH